MHILAIGSPKGGVGKTTLAGTLAALAARVLKLRTALVDADENRSALAWLAEDPDVEGAAGLEPDELRRLRQGQGDDVAVLDLLGGRRARRYVAYALAPKQGETGLDTPERHDRARHVEADIRQLGVEVLGRLGVDVRPLTTRAL